MAQVLLLFLLLVPDSLIGLDADFSAVAIVLELYLRPSFPVHPKTPARLYAWMLCTSATRYVRLEYSMLSYAVLVGLFSRARARAFSYKSTNGEEKC